MRKGVQSIILESAYIVLGGTGLIGSAVREHLERRGETVISIHSRNYVEWIGARTKVLVNCNGNTFRHRANRDPKWDFEASVATVQRSLFDFGFELYLYVSTVDVYNVLDDPGQNHEDATICPEMLMPYAFHKWIAERAVERYAPRSAILRVGTALGPGLRKNPIYDLLSGQPLFMSLDSSLSFIDTRTIARCVSAIVECGCEREIFNVAATGSVRLRDIVAKLAAGARLAAGAEQTIYRYNINNSKMSRLVPMSACCEVVDNYLASLGGTDSR